MSRRSVIVAGALLAALGGADLAAAHAGHVFLGASGSAPAATAAAEPPLTAVPRANCGPGSRPEPGIQGRVPASDHQSGRAAKGYTCNTELLGSIQKPTVQGTVGGFKVERYVDAAGRECAYYDTTLLAGTSMFDQEGGVSVVDMSDPTRPRTTERLVTPAMYSPHESLVLSDRRGLLVAVVGNAFLNAGVIDIYDVSKDCRDPVLRSSTPMGLLGHESGMSPDGRFFYSASPGTSLVAVDISNPDVPVARWVGNINSHGLSIGAEGRRAYVAALQGLLILDTSEIHDGALNPTVHEVARLRWNSMSIPQNAIPVTIEGHPFVIEIDEFGAQSAVGAGRIIDIEDERQPQVVSNLRLEVHQSENFAAQENDPGATNPLQGYAGHYCNVPRRVDPGIVACSMILSGLRVFDIRDPYHPREIAYFNAPLSKRPDTPDFDESSWAMSSPSFAPERGEIWYSDGFNGFFAVRVTNGVWPFRGAAGGGPGADCLSRRSPIGPRNIGRVRIGATRSQLLRLPATPARTRHAFRWCVRGSRGAVIAVFGQGGRVLLVATTAPAHGNRGVRPGAPAARLRAAYPRRTRVGRGLQRTWPRSARLVGVRGGRVRFVAVANRRLLARPAALRRALRRADLR